MTKKRKQHGGRRKGSGRPREYDEPRAKLSVMIDDALLKRLDKYRRTTTRSAIVQAALQRYLAH